MPTWRFGALGKCTRGRGRDNQGNGLDDISRIETPTCRFVGDIYIYGTPASSTDQLASLNDHTRYFNVAANATLQPA